MLLITLEPWGGLAVVTDKEALKFAKKMKSYNQKGVKVFVRFAHEMNGSWYPWSQQPTAYIAALQSLARAIHKATPKQSALVWAPNYGGGYPFTGGQYQARPDSPDYVVLDTNHDGVVDQYDDPYAPYYPGDDAVDWVGMTLYHWGSQYPWGENEIPEADKFVKQLTGNYNGTDGDQTMVPDFYADYAVGRNKPLAIPETAALYVPATGDRGLERQIKEGWWGQFLRAEFMAAYPRIKMINWFEWEKPEAEIGGQTVDWRATYRDDLRIDFVHDLKQAGVGIFPSPR